MAKFFIIGEEGSSDLWLVDLRNGSAEKLDVQSITAAGAGEAEFINGLLNARANGLSIIKGVSFAVASDGLSDASAAQLSTSPPR
jgi:hypothetical protein